MKAGTSDEALRELAGELGVCLLLSDGAFTNGDEDGVVSEPYRPAAVLVPSAEELEQAADRLEEACARLKPGCTHLLVLESDELERQMQARLITLRRNRGFDAVPRTDSVFFEELKRLYKRHRSSKGG